MGFLRDVLSFKIPVLSYCCFYIPIKEATFIIGLLGVIPTIFCFVLASPLCNAYLREHGLPESYTPFIETVYGVLGAIVFVSSVILVIGALQGIMKCYVIYLWIMPSYIAGSFAAAIFVATEAVKSDHIPFGVTCFILGMLQLIISIYFWIVVKSMLFVKKADNNVVNINITII